MDNFNRQSKDKVSIILPIRRNENIRRVLESIHNSTYKNYEVLVIDEGLERSAQRNIGIKKATGEYLLILDSDQYVTPNLLDECVRLCGGVVVNFLPGAINYYYNNGVDAVYIPEVLKINGFFSYIRNWERQFYTGTPIDVVRFVKAKDCPLFDETMSGPEDSAWDRQIKGCRAISRFPFIHNENVGIIGYFKKKHYYSKSMSLFAKKNPGDKVLNFYWRCFGVFLENGKWKRFLSRPDLAIAVLILILIRGIIYVSR